MLVRVDKDADAIYLQLSDEAVESSEEVSDGVILDYTADGRLVGVEILDASKKSHTDTLKHINVAA